MCVDTLSFTKGPSNMRRHSLRRFNSIGALVLAGALGIPGFARAQEKKPNIVFIMGDDIGGCSRASTIAG